MRLLSILLLLLILLPACSVSVLHADAPRRTTVFKAGTEGYPIYRIPAIVRATNGDLLAFCEARQGGDASEIDLVMKRSTDEGATWGPLRVVQESDGFRSLYARESKPRAITVGNPAPVVDTLDPQHPGRIWLPFTVENDRVFVCFSDDHGKSWSAGRDITSAVKKKEWGWYATGPVHGIQLIRGPKRGRLVIPCDHRLGTDGADRGANGVHVIYSDDHGETWTLGAIDDTYEDGLNSNETTAVELSDGKLLFNTRDQNGPAPGTRGVAYSSDGGSSFVTDPKADYPVFRPIGSPLDLPVVQGALSRVSVVNKGATSQLLVFSGPDENGPSGRGRSDLRLRLSTDEGTTWTDGPLLYTGPAAYSDLVPIGSDTLGVLFEAGNPGGSPYERIDFLAVPTTKLAN